MKVGLIGVGYWGPNLLRTLRASRRCELVHIADKDSERRAFAAAAAPEALVSESAETLLEDPEIQAVVIATPAASHFDLVMQALSHGKHILVEKPMARSSAEVRTIGEAATASGLVAMVGHTFLYNDAVRHLRSLIHSGELGAVRYIFGQRLNLGRIRSDVDALWNFGPHDISIIQYLLDEPAALTVSRTGMDYVQPGIDDVVFLHIEYPEKVMAHLHLSWLDPHKVRRMTVVGTKKMAVYDDTAEYKIAVYDKGIDPRAELGQTMDYDESARGFLLRSGDVQFPKIAFREPLRVEIDHWLDCILDGDDCLTGPEHAENVLNILERASNHSIYDPSDA
jgi:predicted dehydrogenase